MYSELGWAIIADFACVDPSFLPILKKNVACEILARGADALASFSSRADAHP